MIKILHAWGKHLSITDDNGVERLRYHYQLAEDAAPSAPKPFCHPIRTPEGREITAESPSDHAWHRGLWMTWKFVNGVNYWEENQEVVGRQVTLQPPTLQAVPGEAGAVCWISEIAWRDRKDGAEQTRLTERRTITCRLVADGAMVLDWISEQTPQEAVILDRAPFTTWGGYSGLVARMTQALQEQEIVLADGTRTSRPTGQRHAWGGIEGQLEANQDHCHCAAFVFLPSPRNRRYPEPMYGNANRSGSFFGPAPLFESPLSLENGEVLRHACRVLILPRRIDADEVDGYHRDWQASETANAV
ncbi:MAG: PmoA family protein [Cytophagales bacterium]|nr:PmoA family protein [Armatimonadota bacterium]